MFEHKPDEPMVMVQSADPDLYFEMLRTTARPNRAFCLRHGIRYACLHGVLNGFHPWHAAYNRFFVLERLIQQDYRGWFLHLDADAYVQDRGFDVAAYLAGHAGQAFIFTHGASAEAWDMNDGVFFANCAHSATRQIIARWMELFQTISVERLREAAQWSQVPDDQHLLQASFRQLPELTAAIHYESNRLINSPGARFVRQVLRAAERDPAKRLRRIAADVERSMAEEGIAAPSGHAALLGLVRALGRPVPADAVLEAADAGPDALADAVAALLAVKPRESRPAAD